MKISDITSELLKHPQLSKKYNQKYIDGVVKEQMILRDYYKTFGKLNEDPEEDEEVELEPEQIQLIDLIPDTEEEHEEEIPDDEPEAIIEPDEIEVEDDEEEFEPEEDEVVPNKPESDGYIRISPREAQEILSYKGKIFQVVFTKKDGQLRAMNGMTGVRKYTSGGELPYSPKDHGVIPVYDLKIGMGPKGYRMINIAGLKTLHINGKKYKIDQTLREIKIHKPSKSLYVTAEKIRSLFLEVIVYELEMNFGNDLILDVIKSSDNIRGLIKHEMMGDGYEVKRKGRSQIVLNTTQLSDDELLEYTLTNDPLKRDITKFLFDYYQESNDLEYAVGEIYDAFLRHARGYDEDDDDFESQVQDVRSIIEDYIYDNDLYIDNIPMDGDFDIFIDRKLKRELDEIKINKPIHFPKNEPWIYVVRNENDLHLSFNQLVQNGFGTNDTGELYQDFLKKSSHYREYIPFIIEHEGDGKIGFSSAQYLNPAYETKRIINQ